MASAQSEGRAEEILNHLTSAFSQFSLSAINSLEAKEVYKKELQKLVYDFSFRNFNKKQSNILNLEELASIYHFPTHYIETPYIKAAKSVSAPPANRFAGKRGNMRWKSFITETKRKKFILQAGKTEEGIFILLGKPALVNQLLWKA